MPFELRWEARGVYRRYYGHVTIAERQMALDQICGDPRFDDLRYAITDYLDVDDFEVTTQATEEAAASHIGPMLSNPKIVIAAVVTDLKIIAYVEHFISLAFISQPYRIFPTLREATLWVAREQFPRVKPPLR